MRLLSPEHPMKKNQNSSFRASALQITNGVHAAALKLRTARPTNRHSTMKTPRKTLGIIRIIGAAVATAAAVVILAFAATLGQAARLPAIAWSPVTAPGIFDYGTAPVGDAESQTFALTNSGSSATGMLSVSLGGAAEFTITADACTGTALGPRKSCNVTVQYAPTTAGQTTATLAANGRRPPASASITLTGTGAVSRHVYWTNSDIGTVGRADLNGQNANQSFITGASGPSGVAVDGSHVYWTNRRFGTVGRADLDGQNANQSFITGASLPSGVAVDGSHVYWANSDHPDTIGRADLNGQNANQSFITGASLPSGVAVDGSHVYWTDIFTNTIDRADLDGQNANQSFITGASGPVGVAVDGSHVYWTNSATNTIGRADLNGQNANQSFITGASAPQGVAVDGSHVFWANANAGTIGRADLDGQNANQSFITGARNPHGVAVDPE